MTRWRPGRASSRPRPWQTAPATAAPTGQADAKCAGEPLTWRDLRTLTGLLATGFGAGFLPWAPGTWGTLLGAAIWWFAFAQAGAVTQLCAVVALTLCSYWLLVALCSARRLGDDSAIVLDEVCGVWVALLFAPPSLAALVAGFALFRLFDIAKPWPVSWAEKAPGGLGVLLDDLIAGAMALTALQALWTIPRLVGVGG